MRGALEGVRVVELCQMVAGPYCSKLLADYGASVIKVEPPEGDRARKLGPFPKDIPSDEASGLFLYLNANKQGITLDVSKPTGSDLFRRLVKEADVVIEDWQPTRLAEAGLGFERLRTLNRRVIMTSITPFGQEGPYKDYKAYHLNSFHAGGEGYVLPGGPEYRDRPPVKGGGYLGDFDAGINAATATLAAIFARHATGAGQHVDISKQESIATLNRTFINKFPNEAVVERRYERGYLFGGIMQCKDGWVEITVGEEHHFRNLAEAINAEWANDPRFRDRQARQQNGELLNTLLKEQLKTISKMDLYHKLQRQHVPVGVFLAPDEVVNSEQMRARGFFQEVEHPRAGRVLAPSSPCHFSETPWRSLRGAPLLGQDNVAVFCGQLGLQQERLPEMRRAGVI